MTSRPSMSGRPRSRMIRSGWRVSAACKPSWAVTASTRRYPWPRSVARRKRRISGSSSIRMMTGPAVVAVAPAAGDGSEAGGVSIMEWPILPRRVAEREREAEEGAAARPVLRGDRTAVRLDDGAADGKAQADPVNAGRPATVELVEDPLLVAWRKARPAVSELDPDRGRHDRGRDVDGTLGRRVPDGVVEEVQEELLDQLGVDRHERQVGREPDLDGPIPERSFESLEGGGQDTVERLRLLADGDGAGLQPRHLEQIVHEAIQMLGFLLDRARQVAASGRIELVP